VRGEKEEEDEGVRVGVWPGGEEKVSEKGKEVNDGDEADEGT